MPRQISFASIAAAICFLACTAHAHAQVQTPGPSQALFDAPYYVCKTNYYVSSTGDDANSGTSRADAWRTLQHANNSMPQGGAAAGTCINVVASKTPYNGVSMTTGGNLASSTGYLVYRCTKLLGCTVNATAGINGNAGFYAAGTGSANYTMIDGFKIVGNNTVYNVGVLITGTTDGTVGTFGSHHVWVLNNSIYNNGQAGIAFAEEDYTYALHNKIFDNAKAPSCDNGAQGSGLGNNVALDIQYQYPNYVPTGDDRTNPNPLIGSFVTGTTWFHNAYEWNQLYNNHVSPCDGSTSADTDGNNIILDTFGTGNGNVVAYPDQTLIAFNLSYNAGGGGIHIFFSEYATVANNSVYNAGLDPYKEGGASGIDTNDSYGNTIINNISVAIPAAPKNQCAFYTKPYAQFNNAILGGVLSGQQLDIFSNNITQLQGGHNSCWGAFGQDPPTGENPMFNGDTYSCGANKCATNPLWVDVGTKARGNENRPPVGANFALQPGSPAVGYGLTETYLPATSVDVGACSSKIAGACP
jgi:hypothetical protein